MASPWGWQGWLLLFGGLYVALIACLSLKDILHKCVRCGGHTTVEWSYYGELQGEYESWFRCLRCGHKKSVRG